MRAVTLRDGRFYLADLDDEWVVERVVALCEPIPRGLVPLFPRERLAD